MSAAGPLTPARRDALLALVALALLAGPLWAPALDLGEPTYRYERLEVTTDGNGVQYANESAVPTRPPISDAIACSGGFETRACAFERLVLENRTVPTDVHTNNPNLNLQRDGLDRYQYVRVSDAVYEPTYVPNRSARNDDGWYRVDLGLEAVDPDEALERVSLRVDSDAVPSTVAEAARDGEATARREVDVPATPIRLADGTYYRVYEADRSGPGPPVPRALDGFLRYVAPFVALYLFARLWTRLEYVGPDDEPTEPGTEWGP